MNLQVKFSFSSEADKAEFKELAAKRGLTLSQFVRWCVYKYRRDREANTAGNNARRTTDAKARRRRDES